MFYKDMQRHRFNSAAVDINGQNRQSVPVPEYMGPFTETYKIVQLDVHNVPKESWIP